MRKYQSGGNTHSEEGCSTSSAGWRWGGEHQLPLPTPRPQAIEWTRRQPTGPSSGTESEGLRLPNKNRRLQQERSEYQKELLKMETLQPSTEM